MSIKLSYFFADFFIARNWIKEEDRIVYAVGFDVIFSTMWQIFIILALSIWRRRIIEALVYLAFFLSVRKYSGGYHASTRIRCFGIFTLAYLLADEVSRCICGIADNNLLMMYGICSLIVANIVFYFFAPIKNSRKRYKEKELQGARGKAFIYLNIWICPALGIAYILPDLAGEIFSAGNIVTILILLCKPWRKRI